MSAKRISRTAAEQMLGGGSAGPGGPLVDLLAAAAAPGRADELSGEESAVAAFHDARVGTLSPHFQRNSSMRSSTLAKALTVKVAGVVLAIGAVGGVAIAAGGGVPGRTPGGQAHRAKPTMETPKLQLKTAPPKPVPPPQPAMADLCRSYFKKGLRPPSQQLVKAAGGNAKILEYCLKTLGAEHKKNKNASKDKRKRLPPLPTSWPKNQKWPLEWPEEWKKHWPPKPGKKHDWLEGWPGLQK